MHTQYDDSGRTIPDFFVLCAAQLNHALCGRMRDLNLSQNSVAIVGEDDAAHGVEQHLEHGLGTQT